MAKSTGRHNRISVLVGAPNPARPATRGAARTPGGPVPPEGNAARDDTPADDMFDKMFRTTTAILFSTMPGTLYCETIFRE